MTLEMLLEGSRQIRKSCLEAIEEERRVSSVTKNTGSLLLRE